MTAILLTLLLALIPIQGQTVRAVEVALAVTMRYPTEERSMAMCIFWEESRYNRFARGAIGERGIAQINPAAHADRIRRLGYILEDLWQVEANVAVAADIWRESGWQRPWVYAARLCEERGDKP